MNHISIAQLDLLPEESYVLIDIRDAGSIAYGMMPGAIHIPFEELMSNANTYLQQIDQTKKIIIYWFTLNKYFTIFFFDTIFFNHIDTFAQMSCHLLPPIT